VIPWLAGWVVVVGLGVPAPAARFDPPTGSPVPTGFAGAQAIDSWIAEDKAQHFVMSFAVTGMSYGAARLAVEPTPARSTAAGVTLLLGVGKEIFDARSGGWFRVKDLIWDAAGLALGYALVQRID